jgi:hypothetical protein
MQFPNLEKILIKKYITEMYIYKFFKNRVIYPVYNEY